MTAKTMMPYIEGSSAIRAMFEEGTKLARKYGAENVYDFSLGNPNVPAPAEFNQAIKDILDEEDPLMLHGYNKSNLGYEDVRQTVAEHINSTQGTSFTAENIVMTVGAAGGLNVAIKILVDPGEEVLVFAPYFGEYNSYTKNHGAVLKAVPADTVTFQPDIEKMAEMITEKTRAVIVNSPNNPTGVVYSEETIKKLAQTLRNKQEELGTEIYIISDEPYRELAYDGVEVPYITKYYDNTIVGYSWSKSLSIPGERIGYLVIPGEIADFDNLIAAATTINRVMGFVNAPSLIQRAAARCINCSSDIGAYDRNRKALYEGLTDAGYECVFPEGAFYLFVKSPIDDDVEFCAKAKDYRILIVPGSAFGCPGFVRISYCVAYDTIVNSLPQFAELMKEMRG